MVPGNAMPTPAEQRFRAFPVLPPEAAARYYRKSIRDVELHSTEAAIQAAIVKRASMPPARSGTACAPMTESAPARLALLDPTQIGSQAKWLESTLRRHITAHDEAVREIARTYQTHVSGMGRVGRPIGSFLFLGPPGSGKTRTVEAVAEALLGNPRAVTKINCAEFRHSYEVTKLIGSPSGCPEDPEAPLLTQDVLERHRTTSRKISLVVFESVEKASDAVWNRLLGILNNATLVLGDRRKVDFSKSLIFMTSASVEMVRSKSGFHVGPLCSHNGGPPPNGNVERRRSKRAHQKFTPEVLDHFDRIVFFKT